MTITADIVDVIKTIRAEVARLHAELPGDQIGPDCVQLFDAVQTPPS